MLDNYRIIKDHSTAKNTHCGISTCNEKNGNNFICQREGFCLWNMKQ